jgi:hypothetical protein
MSGGIPGGPIPGGIMGGGGGIIGSLTLVKRLLTTGCGGLV